MSNGSLMVIVLYVVEDLIAQRFVLVIVKSLSELNNLFAKLMVQRLFGGEFIHDEDSSL